MIFQMETRFWIAKRFWALMLDLVLQGFLLSDSCCGVLPGEWYDMDGFILKWIYMSNEWGWLMQWLEGFQKFLNAGNEREGSLQQGFYWKAKVIGWGDNMIPQHLSWNRQLRRVINCLSNLNIWKVLSHIWPILPQLFGLYVVPQNLPSLFASHLTYGLRLIHVHHSGLTLSNRHHRFRVCG